MKPKTFCDATYDFSDPKVTPQMIMIRFVKCERIFMIGSNIRNFLTNNFLFFFFTMISFDDAVNSNVQPIYDALFTPDRKNPNGCPIRGQSSISSCKLRISFVLPYFKYCAWLKNVFFEWFDTYYSILKSLFWWVCSGTFYLSHQWTDYRLVQQLYKDGHDVALHSTS